MNFIKYYFIVLSVIILTNVVFAQSGANFVTSSGDTLMQVDTNGTVSATAFVGDGSGLTGISSGADNLGNHTATQNIKLNGHYLSGDGDNEGIFVNNDGHVGIYPSTPNGGLHVGGDYYGSGHIWLYAFEGNGSSGTAYIQARDSSGSSNINMQLRTQNAGSIVDALYISSAGNVGIGTSSPTKPLAIKGTGTNGEWLGLKDSIGTTIWHLNNKDGGFNFVETGIADNRLYLQQGGNVGIGTSTPTNKLDVVGSATFSGTVGIGTLPKPDFPLTMNALGSNSGWMDLHNTSGARSWEINNKNGGFSIAEVATTGGTRFFLEPGGNVGIGTGNPSNKLSVNGNADISENLSVAGNADFSGYLGIGTSTPTKAQVEIDGFQTASLSSYGFLNYSGSTGISSGANPYSLYASDRIAAREFNAFSDARIKNILGRSNGEQDLSTLMGIEITDYTMIDTVANGTQSYKKVIAQQVEKVYPQAVSTITDVVPDIYQRANIEDGWVMLATDLQPGEKVKLISKDGNDIYDVLAVREGAFQVDLADNGDVFVYGREVNDFHTVDYEAISMLNVSATQAQQRIIEKEQSEIAALKAQIGSLQSQNEKLASQNSDFENRFAQIEMAIKKMNSIKLTSVNK